METLIEILYLISSALLVPVMLVLLGFLAWCLLEVGGFLREWQDRRSTAANWMCVRRAIRRVAGSRFNRCHVL